MQAYANGHLGLRTDVTVLPAELASLVINWQLPVGSNLAGNFRGDM